MGNVYIFRGKAATGKTTLANMLAKKLSIPVFCKDDIVDALKITEGFEWNTDNRVMRNAMCYNILQKMMQTNIDLGIDFVMDIALGDRTGAEEFLNRLDFKNSRVLKFFIDCSDDNEWKRRHEERIKNPLPHQSFKSFKHVVEHYEKFDLKPFDDEYLIDTSSTIEKCIGDIHKIIDK